MMRASSSGWSLGTSNRNVSPPSAGILAATWLTSSVTPGMSGKMHAHCCRYSAPRRLRSEEHTSELQSRQYLVCRLLLEKKNKIYTVTQLMLVLMELVDDLDSRVVTGIIRPDTTSHLSTLIVRRAAYTSRSSSCSSIMLR